MSDATKPDTLPSIYAEYSVIKLLAQHHLWVAPVGARDLRGWMVCRRSMNNVDGPNTRVDYLRVDLTATSRWKKPFRECEHAFPTLELALQRALEAVQRAEARPKYFSPEA